MKGTRAQLSADQETAFADLKSQDIKLVESYTNKVDEYLCSALSVVHRLPPFSFCEINGYSYLRIKPPKSENLRVMFLPDTKISIVSLLD